MAYNAKKGLGETLLSKLSCLKPKHKFLFSNHYICNLYSGDNCFVVFLILSDNQDNGPPALASFIIIALCPLGRRWLYMEQTAKGTCCNCCYPHNYSILEQICKKGPFPIN